MAGNYLDVADQIRRRIESGEYPADRPLPAERILGETFDVHRATLRRAIARLETEGLIRRAPGERPYPSPPSRPMEGTIGLYATDTDVYSRSLIATGIVEALREQNSALRLVWSDDRAFQPGEPFSPEIRSHAGMILWPPTLTDADRLRELRESMPTVIVDAPVSGYESDFVGFDDDGGGYEAARHLFEMGHRAIAFVGPLQIVTARYRRHGFTRLLHERGLEPIRGYESIAHANRLPSNVLDAFLDTRPEDRPTAFVCENDETAALLMPHLTARGLRVPEDFALIGFGGVQPVLLSALGLTTMEQPFVEVGRQATRLLLNRLAGRSGPSERIRLPMHLQVRSSSGRQLAPTMAP